MKNLPINSDKKFKYSITFQSWDEESLEVGQTDNQGFIEKDEVDTIGEILHKANSDYGIYMPVSFGTWESTEPIEDKDYFEKGIKTYFGLHLKNEDGTEISEEENDFITFLLSDGRLEIDKFREYAVGGLVAGAIAIGIGGLIAYYYFKGKKKASNKNNAKEVEHNDIKYPIKDAWRREHKLHNKEEDYEVPKRKRKRVSYAEGGLLQGITSRQYFLVVKNWVYFTFNFPSKFVTEMPEFHQDKWGVLYSKYGALSVAPSFWKSVSKDIQLYISNWIRNNYVNSQSEKEELNAISEKDYFDIIFHWNLFCQNPPMNFIEGVFGNEGEHFEHKWVRSYERAGAIGSMNKFFTELSVDNQEKLTNWVYKNFKPMNFAGGGLLSQEELEKNAEIYFSENYNLSKSELLKDLEKYTQMKEDLNEKRITPRQVVGTGYVNARKVANEWINGRIQMTSYLINHFDEKNRLTEQQREQGQFAGGGSLDLSMREKAEMYSYLDDNNWTLESFMARFNKDEEEADDIIMSWAKSRGYDKKSKRGDTTLNKNIMKKTKGSYAGGGSTDLEYSDILNVLQSKIEDSIDEIPNEYENSDTYTGEEIEHEYRDGFIPYTDGGYQAHWFEFISQMFGAGYTLPTKQLEDEMQRQIKYSFDSAKENFIEKYPEIVEELGEENIDYHSLYEAGYGEEAEELSSDEMDMMSEDTILMRIFANYYNPDNSRAKDGKHTIRLFGDVNLESPYHRTGNLDDSYEYEFTFDSIAELESEMDKGLEKVISWFKGDMYNDSTTEMKVRRMADGGEAGNPFYTLGFSDIPTIYGVYEEWIDEKLKSMDIPVNDKTRLKLIDALQERFEIDWENNVLGFSPDKKSAVFLEWDEDAQEGLEEQDANGDWVAKKGSKYIPFTNKEWENYFESISDDEDVFAKGGEADETFYTLGFSDIPTMYGVYEGWIDKKLKSMDIPVNDKTRLKLIDALQDRFESDWENNVLGFSPDKKSAVFLEWDEDAQEGLEEQDANGDWVAKKGSKYIPFTNKEWENYFESISDDEDIFAKGGLAKEKYMLLYDFVDEKMIEGDSVAESMINEKGYSLTYDELYDFVDEKMIEGDIDAENLLNKINSFEYAGGGRVTTNEDVLKSFLTSTKEVKANNLSTHFNQSENTLLLRNYGTIIAGRRIDDNQNDYHNINYCFVTKTKYSVTTTKILNKLKALAVKMGYTISDACSFANGGMAGLKEGVYNVNRYTLTLKKESGDNWKVTIYDNVKKATKIDKILPQQLAFLESLKIGKVFAGGGEAGSSKFYAVSFWLKDGVDAQNWIKENGLTNYEVEIDEGDEEINGNGYRVNVFDLGKGKYNTLSDLDSVVDIMIEDEEEYAGGGKIYSSDELYILKVSDFNGNLLDSSKKIRARNLSEAKQIAIDDFESDMQKKYGQDLRFKVELAPLLMRKGGEAENTFVNVLMDYGFVEKRSAYGVRHFYNKLKDFYASLDEKQRRLDVYKDDDMVVQGREYSGYSIQELINYLNENGFKSGSKYAGGGKVKGIKKKAEKLLEQSINYRWVDTDMGSGWSFELESPLDRSVFNVIEQHTYLDEFSPEDAGFEDWDNESKEQQEYYYEEWKEEFFQGAFENFKEKCMKHLDDFVEYIQQAKEYQDEMNEYAEGGELKVGSVVIGKAGSRIPAKEVGEIIEINGEKAIVNWRYGLGENKTHKISELMYAGNNEYAEGGEVEDWMEEALDSLMEETGSTDLEISYVSDNGNSFYATDNNLEYRVFKSEDDAEETAIEQVREDMEESPENFNQDFIKDYIDGREYFEDVLNEMNYSYAYDIQSEKDDKYESRLIAEMVEWGILDDVDAHSSNAEEIANDNIDDFVTLLTNEQLGQGNNGLDYFISNFGEEETMKMVIDNNLIDIDEASKDAVQTDGIGHFLSYYDGETLYLKDDCVAYRVN